MMYSGIAGGVVSVREEIRGGWKARIKSETARMTDDTPDSRGRIRDSILEIRYSLFGSRMGEEKKQRERTRMRRMKGIFTDIALR
jgi:hypothetical protein